MNPMNLGERLKTLFIGKSRDLSDQKLFHRIGLIAVFAWVAVGADGISSSCYGPEAAFVALRGHEYLSVFIALASVFTIVVICASYSQIIEAFPAGGGGYVVASKLLSPAAGVVAGCALIIDYVLTIAVSIASGTDALFSFLPPHWQPYKFGVAMAGVSILILLNLRGVKESVLVCLPVFSLFILTHAFAIIYALVVTHVGGMSGVVTATVQDVKASYSEVGLGAMLLMLLRAYSHGAGTYTGIEAVSNSMPMMREPRVETGKRTMRYMAASLAITVAGLLVAYLLWQVKPVEGKTLNAVLFESMTEDWPQQTAFLFVLVTLISEAGLLVIAAQAGFVGGPQVLANMALDRWFPTRFATLSDRFVTQNGVLLMGAAAVAVIFFTNGSVGLLVVLYSINVFITFTLSQLGMVRHWWQQRATLEAWKKKISINGIGFVICFFILVSLSVIKFKEGGWVTLVVTGLLVLFAFAINRHYRGTAKVLRRLDDLIEVAELSGASVERDPAAAAQGPKLDPKAKTAVLLVNGFNGLGLHTLLAIMRMFPGVFRNFIFVQVGVVDAGNFKGAAEIENCRRHAEAELQRYVNYMRQHGYYAEGIASMGTDLVAEVSELSPEVFKRFPHAVFFGGQLVFPDETFVTRWLHNYAVFALQRKFYQQGFPFLILPIRV
ncbi:MAG TPA: APC family permease [Verrucomicrobiae bacterium]|nr:APC family permease [Verrucomicrobiae bacterium]